MAPPSAGVTLGQRISARVSSTGSTGGWLAATSIPQQFVDGNLRSCLLVDALDDDGAVQARSGRSIRQRLARGHRAGDDDGVGRHAAIVHFTGGAVDDLRGSA